MERREWKSFCFCFKTVVLNYVILAFGLIRVLVIVFFLFFCCDGGVLGSVLICLEMLMGEVRYGEILFLGL